ncbi:tetraspanin-3-like [Oryza brachyantha]|uniref:Tetraspanin n=1 Tax=Oryza brachyantha TaxID=4533 RepID=J3LUV6_ORYBR|nr:tetraspanin-3-like [Oryza brachyantha]
MLFILLSLVKEFATPLFLLVVGPLQAPDVCTHGVFLRPTVGIGIFVMLVFILRCCSREQDNSINSLFRCYLVGVSVAVIALLGFVVFGFVAVGGVDLGQLTAHTYKLEDYGGWLKGRVADPQYWAATAACLRDEEYVCRGDGAGVTRRRQEDPKTGVVSDVVRELYSYEHRIDAMTSLHKMPPIEAGCCTPPRSCAMIRDDTNGTTTTLTRNADCGRWSNDEETLCFQCDSCKAVFLDNTKKAWTAFVWAPTLALIALVCRCQRELFA